jgi:hypothetical protein
VAYRMGHDHEVNDWRENCGEIVETGRWHVAVELASRAWYSPASLGTSPTGLGASPAGKGT